MKTKIFIKKRWRAVKRFFIWMQIHHLKNFLIFWIRLGLVLAGLIVTIVVYNMDDGDIMMILVLPSALIFTAICIIANIKAIKRLNKKYTIYLKEKYAKFPNFIKSLFGQGFFGRWNFDDNCYTMSSVSSS